LRLVAVDKDIALPLSFLSIPLLPSSYMLGIQNRVHRTENHGIVVAWRVRFRRLTMKPPKPFSSILSFISVDGVFWYTKHVHYTLVWI
jgi:hypothetical protein